MTILRGISVADSASMDAFDRLRVSEPASLLDVKMTAGISAARWITAAVNGATIAASQQCAADVVCSILSILVTTINASDQTYQGALSWRSLR